MVSFTGAKRWHVAMAIALVLSSLLILLTVSQVSAASMMPRATSVGYKSFTITWVTSIAEIGYVNYGTSTGNLKNTAYDDRGQKTEDDTHHITITGLTASDTYYYEIVSGGATYNNGGVPYEITTGPDLGPPPMPEIISGKIYKADGITAAEGTIIYANIGTSQVLSVLADGNGTWGMDIAALRTADYQDYHTYSNGDDINIEAWGVADGTATQTVTVDIARSGTAIIELAPDAPAGLNANEGIEDVDKPVQSDDAAREVTPEGTGIEPEGKINLWLIVGMPVGVIALAVTIWFINRNRY